MTYVDGFVIVIKKDKLESYKEMAKLGAKVWKKYGALEYFECVGDDLTPEFPQEMKILTFPELTKAKEDERVIFSFIIYESKEKRDEINKKVMQDQEMNSEWKDKPMPFDMKRFSFGGFKTIVEERK